MDRRLERNRSRTSAAPRSRSRSRSRNRWCRRGRRALVPRVLMTACVALLAFPESFYAITLVFLVPSSGMTMPGMTMPGMTMPGMTMLSGCECEGCSGLRGRWMTRVFL